MVALITGILVSKEDLHGGTQHIRIELLHPMIRKSIKDPWQKVSWEEAINYAASEIKRIQQKYGSNSVGAISSSRCTNEEVYLMQKIVRARFWE